MCTSMTTPALRVGACVYLMWYHYATVLFFIISSLGMHVWNRTGFATNDADGSQEVRALAMLVLPAVRLVLYSHFKSIDDLFCKLCITYWICRLCVAHFNWPQLFFVKQTKTTCSAWLKISVMSGAAFCTVCNK